MKTRLFYFVICFFFVLRSSSSFSQPRASIQQRFAAFSSKLPKTDVAEQRLYASCLFHSGDERQCFSYMQKVISPKSDDIVLYLRYYSLCKKYDLYNSDDIERNLIGEVVIKPFDAIAAFKLGRDHLRRKEWSTAKDLFHRAVKLDPRYFDAYFELAKSSKSLDEINRHSASALLSCEIGSEASREILDFLEKLKK